MKLIEIINKYCKCKIIEIAVVNPTASSIVYSSASENLDDIREISFNKDDINISIKYISDEELSKDNISLIEDLISVYGENDYTLETILHKGKDAPNKQSLLTLGNYMAIIAHEIRNPLISIGGFAKILMKSLQQEDLKHMAGIITKEANRLEHLTEDILAFSRKHPLKKEKIIIVNMLQDIIPLFEKRLQENNFEININIPEEASIYADINQIKQVVINLIANAMNAMKKDGTMYISYEERDDKSCILFSDTGPGIASEVLPNLFDPFFTTSPTGTGLGLPISRKILDSHNGDLLAHNSDKGAVFTIILPKHDDI